MSIAIDNNPIQKKLFAMLLAVLALGGLYGIVSLPASFEKARNQNLAIVKAERVAFWQVHEQAAQSVDDANQIAFIASSAIRCHPSAATTDIEETRKVFIEAEARCLGKLRTQYGAGEGYNRTVALIDWASANKI